jgi:hypothetical protein
MICFSRRFFRRSAARSTVSRRTSVGGCRSCSWASGCESCGKRTAPGRSGWICAFFGKAFSISAVSWMAAYASTQLGNHPNKGANHAQHCRNKATPERPRCGYRKYKEQHFFFFAAQRLETTQIYTRLCPLDLKCHHERYHPRG